MGTGRLTLVELEPFAKALGFTVKPCNGGFLVTTDPKSDQGSEICESGQAVVDGNKIALATGTGGQTLVSLSDMCGFMGAKLVVNRDANSLDVYLEAQSKPRGPSLKDGWNTPGVATTAKNSLKMSEGPAKVGVQFFECFSLLPPIRDVKEMAALHNRQSDIDRFHVAYLSNVTPELGERAYPLVAGQIDRVIQASTMLSSVPVDELERYVASKPEVGKRFTESMVSWESMRSSTAKVLNQEVRGPQALVEVEQKTTNPATGQVKSTHYMLKLVQQMGKWKVAGAQGGPKT